jgi:hypothetical protein
MRPSPGALWALQIEPHVPGFAADIGHDDPAGAPDRAAALRGTGGAGTRHVVGQRQAALITRPAGDLLRPRHAVLDSRLGGLQPGFGYGVLSL